MKIFNIQKIFSRGNFHSSSQCKICVNALINILCQIAERVTRQQNGAPTRCSGSTPTRIVRSWPKVDRPELFAEAITNSTIDRPPPPSLGVDKLFTTYEKVDSQPPNLRPPKIPEKKIFGRPQSGRKIIRPPPDFCSVTSVVSDSPPVNVFVRNTYHALSFLSTLPAISWPTCS